MRKRCLTRGLNALSRPQERLPRAPCRAYHDESFGFRKRGKVVLPDYTQSQLENRTVHAPLLRYVDSMRTHGHRAARVDPLDLLQRDEVAALDPTRYGLIDPSKSYPIDGIIWSSPNGPNLTSDESWTLEEIKEHLRSVYVGNIAYEYMHSPSKTERLWFSHILESTALSPQNVRKAEEKKRIWELLTRSEVFDQYLQLKFPNLKRYGLEGGESMLPALDTLFNVASAAGIEHVILGMPHRGRLNLLTDLLQFSPAALFNKIKGGSELPEELGYSGDVISHLVANPTLRYGNPARNLKVSLLPNPSHLEAVDPVALGKTRAKQFSLIKEADPECQLGDKVMCVQLHGDASFTGQGVVMESLGLSNLPHFTSGGSVHLVVNNNIGYTTPASSARSSLYCSDIAKMINCPVLHVNGDHPEDVSRALDTAFQYRKAFRKDIVVDLLVYRRWGHNELDEPAFTQPLMYQKIRTRKSVPVMYEEKLINENVLSKEDITQLRSSYKAQLDSELTKADAFTPHLTVLQGKKWKGMVLPASDASVHNPETGVPVDTLKEVGRASVAVPEGFEIHPRLKRHITARQKSLESGAGIDWATGEAMAFGTLLNSGFDVRISGQDVGRGTFSQRHAMLVDQNTESVTVPLNAQLQSEGKLELANSSLSEYAVLGFEYGMSWETPRLLPIWEAQFGDFFNGAQIIFDTYISSGETKWATQSGLVVLLPHGLDGAGPEHSSMRYERMLQLTNDPVEYHDGREAARINMHVAYPTTPAQYFHLLRRQMLRNYRRPLIVAAPKGLLRLPSAASTISEFAPGTRFHPVLDDPQFSGPESDSDSDAGSSAPESVERVVLLAGKVYYDLVKERAARGGNGNGDIPSKVAFVRLEELAPFPFRALRDTLARYPHARDVCWLQEEPRNQGAWTHVAPRIDAVLEQIRAQRVGAGASLGVGSGRGAESEAVRARVRYVGRKEDAVPAVGVGKVYKAQQNAVIHAAFEGLS